MKLRLSSLSRACTLALTALLLLGSNFAYADDGRLATYRVTLTNLTHGQPLSPPVAATHRPSLHIFRVGGFASAELEAIAEAGNEVLMFNALNAAERVTQAVDVGRPLTPHGRVVGSFTDTVTFEIQARPGDRFSLATMLICTNDGFTGVNGVRLPRHGASHYYLNGYDAGTEQNTELSRDIVDPCSALGPAPLNGDPNGNEDAAVDSTPQRRIRHHPNIQGNGDLTHELHGWYDPVAVLVIERVSP